MISPRGIATLGLSCSRRPLAIATIGFLCVSSVPDTNTSDATAYLPPYNVTSRDISYGVTLLPDREHVVSSTTLAGAVVLFRDTSKAHVAQDEGSVTAEAEEVAQTINKDRSSVGVSQSYYNVQNGSISYNIRVDKPRFNVKAS